MTARPHADRVAAALIAMVAAHDAEILGRDVLIAKLRAGIDWMPWASLTESIPPAYMTADHRTGQLALCLDTACLRQAIADRDTLNDMGMFR